MLFLIAITVVVGMLRKQRDYAIDPAILDTVGSRIVAWWLLFGSLIGAFLLESSATVVLFGLISFWALREYITLTPTRLADHSSLFWVFFLWTPLQFTLVGVNREWFQSVFGIEPYMVFSILIPTYAFLILPASIALSGDSKHFLERIAKIQVGLLICVYSLSFAPAILTMPLPPTPAARAEDWATSPLMGHVLETTVDAARPLLVMPEIILPAEKNDVKKIDLENPRDAENSRDVDAPLANDITNYFDTHFDTNFDHRRVEHSQVEFVPKSLSSPFAPLSPEVRSDRAIQQLSPQIRLLFFFVLLTQVSDMLQYLASQLFRNYIVAPTINRTRTWLGVGVGVVSTGLLGVTLWFFTPYPLWWQSGLVAMAVSTMGFAGSITMSAIKRDRGVDDYGKLIEGHSGVLDRIDSLCFAAPVFYHLTWIFL